MNSLRSNIIHYGPSLETTGVQNWPLVVNCKIDKQQTLDHCLDIQTYKRGLKILSLLVDLLQVSHVGYCFFSADLANILLYRYLWRIIIYAAHTCFRVRIDKPLCALLYQCQSDKYSVSDKPVRILFVTGWYSYSLFKMYWLGYISVT